MEHCDGDSKSKEEEPFERRTTDDDDHDDGKNGDEDFVNVSGNSIKDRETIGNQIIFF